MTERNYSRSKFSMMIFGAYLIVVGGFGFGLFPHWTLSLIGMKTIDETFVRLVGLLAFILGVNYFLMIQQSAIIFFKLSTLMRFFAGVYMCLLVFNGVSPLNLLLLAFGDIAGATWTLFALIFDRDDEQKQNKRRF